MKGEHDPMVAVAAARGRVRMTDGRVVTLVGWPRSAGGYRAGSHARIQLPSGAYTHVATTEIVEIVDDPATDFDPADTFEPWTQPVNRYPSNWKRGGRNDAFPRRQTP